MTTIQEDVAQKLLAFEVHDGDDGWALRFASTNVVARREGAAEMGMDFESVEHCKRSPKFDQYAPGPVPASALIENGWTIQCSHCEREVSQHMFDALADEDLDPDDFEIVTEGQRAYCSRTCQGEHRAWFRGRAAAESALIELVLAKYPQATIKRVHICGSTLERTEPGSGMRCLAEFLFPGAKYGGATFVFGDQSVYVARGDVDAFNALYGKSTNTQGEEVSA